MDFWQEIKNAISKVADFSTTEGIIYFVLEILILVLSIWAMWRMFTKAGEKGWKSLIPIYDIYILFKLVWSRKAFWCYFLLTILLCASSVVVSQTVEGETVNKIFAIAFLVLAVILFVVTIMLDIKISYAYGHGAGFAVGLIFLNLIFMLIIGLGSSQYTGSFKKEAAKKE